MLKINEVYLGDCLNLMEDIEDQSIDTILCDLPYGTTACKWDFIIPLELLWKHYKRIIKKNKAIILTAIQPFTTTLISSNLNSFKYCWIWDKVKPSGFQIAKFRPMMRTEDILIFSSKGERVDYFPIMVIREKLKKSYPPTPSDSSPLYCYDHLIRSYTHKFPQSILVFSNANQTEKLHPTQKSVKLFEYLIKTYSKKEDLILDNCAGSGTTAIACLNTGRNYILMEKEKKYFEIIQQRIEEHKNPRKIGSFEEQLTGLLK